MAGIDLTTTSYGYVVSCTSGTAAATLLVNRDVSIPVIGVHFSGANTADIITVSDADGNLFLKGYGSTGLSNHNITFPIARRINGLKVQCAGAATGVAVIYTE